MNARVWEEEEMTQQAGSSIRYLPIEKDYRQAEKRTSTGRRSDQYCSQSEPLLVT